MAASETPVAKCGVCKDTYKGQHIVAERMRYYGDSFCASNERYSSQTTWEAVLSSGEMVTSPPFHAEKTHQINWVLKAKIVPVCDGKQYVNLSINVVNPHVFNRGWVHHMQFRISVFNHKKNVPEVLYRHMFYETEKFNAGRVSSSFKNICSAEIADGFVTSEGKIRITLDFSVFDIWR